MSVYLAALPAYRLSQYLSDDTLEAIDLEETHTTYIYRCGCVVERHTASGDCNIKGCAQSSSINQMTTRNAALSCRSIRPSFTIAAFRPTLALNPSLERATYAVIRL